MKLTFSSPVATDEFSKFAGILNAALLQHHFSGFEILSSHGRVIGPQDGLKKVSRGLSRVTA